MKKEQNFMNLRSFLQESLLDRNLKMHGVVGKKAG
jgi:hypothetical protein